jgi:2-deoxystreptamine N-acetyl-D-glucosaminyltransferase/2-deoxystreptamine glucosyltransferase
VAGRGPEAERLRALANGVAAGRVLFVGAVANHEMPEYFNAADVLVHPSLRAEGLPTVVVEAMASGVPVVATDAGGTASAVRHGQTGVLVPRADVAALAAALQELLTDRARAEKLAAEALVTARERFAWPGLVDRLLADLGVA